MARIRFRILAAGLGLCSLPACVTMQMEMDAPKLPTSATNLISPTASPAPPTQTVMRRVEAPATPVQYIAVPADQLVRDASGRTLVKASAIPPGYMPVPAPVTSGPTPVAVAAHSPLPAMMPTSTPSAVTTQPAPVTSEPIEMVAVSHTHEPPLAPVDSPKRLPEAVKQSSMSVPSSSQTSNGMPAYVPPGGQLLVLQPDGTGLQPAAHKSPPSSASMPTSDALPNLLIPSTPPEELRLVTTPKSNCHPTPLQAALQAYQTKSPQEAEKQLAIFDPINRDLLKKMLPLAAKLGDQNGPAANPAEFADMVDQLQQMVSTMRAKATLQIAKLSYCRLPARPVRQGVYQPLPEDHVFRVGETVELYMELRNFSCEPREREFMTHLATVIEVRDERNEVVMRHEFERDRPDVGQAAKAEHFQICRFPIQNLPAGSYTLTALVTDVPSGKSANRTLPLRVDSTARRVARGTSE